MEKRASEAETALKRVEDELASLHAEYNRYIQVALPATLEDARQQEVEDFKQSEEFNSRLLAEYKDGMRDMKASFALTNPTVTGVDWSFVPEMSGETAVEEEGTGTVKEGEVTGVARDPVEVVEATGVAREPEEFVIIDKLEQAEIPEQPSAAISDVPASESVLAG